jgi:chromosome segregation ATPase
VFNMDYFKADVKKYEKKYKKRTKTGKTRYAVTVQYSIPLNKDNPFQEENFIYILTENEINDIQSKLDTYEQTNNVENSDSKKIKIELESFKTKNKELEALKSDHKAKILTLQNQIENQDLELQKYSTQIEDLQSNFNDLQVRYDKRQNKNDALSERLNKSLKRESELERELRKYTAAMIKIESRGFMDRMFNRIPEDVKQLTAGIIEEKKGK